MRIKAAENLHLLQSVAGMCTNRLKIITFISAADVVQIHQDVYDRKNSLPEGAGPVRYIKMGFFKQEDYFHLKKF